MSPSSSRHSDFSPRTSGGYLAPGENGAWDAFLGWVRDNVITLLTASGLLYYAAVRLSAGRFYDRFGLRPEEVGLGYAELIIQTVYGLLYLVAVGAIWGLGFAVAVWVVRGIWRLSRGRSWRPPRTESSTGAALLVPVALWVVQAIGMSIATASDSAEDVRDGFPTPGSILSGVLRWNAEAAIVSGAGTDTTEPFDRCVIYLGQAEGMAALYDPASRYTWRVPVGAVKIRTGGPLAIVNRVPEDCPLE